jgi:serum/glucocorticoid-regulated kinase 2
MLNDVQHNNWSLTHLAVFLGNEKMVLWVMNEGGDLSLETKDGWDCILLAIWQGHYQGTKLQLMG